MLRSSLLRLGEGCVNVNVSIIRGARRSIFPPPWMPSKYRTYGPMGLSPDNEDFASHPRIKSPLKEEPLTDSSEWRPLAKRTGLIVKKIGVLPQWQSNGTRIMATLLQVLDNHVISYQSPEEWWKQSIVGKRKAFNRKGTFGKLTVGAIPTDPNALTSVYLGLFDKAGCGPKKRLASFMVTEDACLQPGTRLQAAHFQVFIYSFINLLIVGSI